MSTVVCKYRYVRLEKIVSDWFNTEYTGTVMCPGDKHYIHLGEFPDFNCDVEIIDDCYNILVKSHSGTYYVKKIKIGNTEFIFPPGGVDLNLKINIREHCDNLFTCCKYAGTYTRQIPMKGYFDVTKAKNGINPYKVSLIVIF